MHKPTGESSLYNKKTYVQKSQCPVLQILYLTLCVRMGENARCDVYEIRSRKVVT